MKARAYWLVTLVFLAGCSTQTAHLMQPSMTRKMDPAQIKLAEAAASVSNSLQTLARIETAMHPHAKLPPPTDPAVIDMMQISSVDWSGPIEPVVREIAKTANYRVRILGRRPAIPAIISITAQNKPLADILRDVKYQAQKKANIVVYPRTRVIELRYIRRRRG